MKKKKSLGFYLVIAFLSFLILSITFIGVSLNSFIKFTNTKTEVVKIIDEEPLNTQDSTQVGQASFDPFDGKRDLYNIDVTHIYKSRDDFYSDVELLKNVISPKFEMFESTLNTKENVKIAFDLYDKGYFITEKVYWYAQYQVSLDASDEEIQNLVDVSDNVIQTFTDSTSYIWPELSMLDESTLKDILNYTGISKSEYERTLWQIIEMKNHILSPETEEALAMLSTFNSSPKNIWDKITVLDPIFNVYRMDDGTLIDFRNEEDITKYQNDPEISPHLFEYYTRMDRQNENALAEILMSEVQKNIAYSKIKKYDDFLDYGLSYDEVPSELYLNLLKKVESNLATLHRYQELENKMYDDNLLPIISNEFSMDKSREILSESYKVFGDDYINKFNFALDNNWFDLISREFKEQGAYTSGMKLVHPYIIMTYNGTLADLSTLTHEYGHMANYKYSQDAVIGSSWTPNAFTAEVPSTFNEAILSDYLRAAANTTDEKLAYLNSELSLINNTFFYQAMLASFQYKIYEEVDEGNILSADELNKLFGDLYIKYYGEHADGSLFEGTNSYWSQISHFYSGFYVYKYSTSLAIAYSIKEKINANEISMDDYLKFLEHGAIISPSDSLKTLNIDLKSDKWMDDFFKYYETLVNEYDELLKLKEAE
ncbi:MAG: M3 family metallopeptidase [Acidaminobacteraceae bacterium]